MQLTRTKKLALNTIVSLVNQLVTVICGFILPRMFLVHYGSAVNGLQASISQFFGVIMLCEMGIGAVAQSALYKPLAQKQQEKISEIFCSAKKFFHRVGYVLIVYTFLLMIFYPLLIKKEFGFLYTSSLILILSISSFAHYFLGISYRVLLNADQMGFISTGLRAICLLISTLVCIFLINMGAGIHIVKLLSALILLIQPILLSCYVHHRYTINHHLKLFTEPLKQKWNGVAQHISAFILGGTDMVVLTIFSTLNNVSVYMVYYMVVYGIYQFIDALIAGTQSMMGNMLAKQETKKLTNFFSFFEWGIHTISVFLFGMTGLLILPFVKVYTAGVTDINYVFPAFAILLVLAQAIACIRIPYTCMFLAAGHFKQTQTSSFIEAGLNLGLSIVLVFNYGLIGVAIGTLVAVSYRTVYLAWYLSKNIINRRLSHFIKHLFVDVLIIAIMIATNQWWQMQSVSYMDWLVLAFKTGIVCVSVCIGINWLFYRREIMEIGHRVFNKFQKCCFRN